MASMALRDILRLSQKPFLEMINVLGFSRIYLKRETSHEDLWNCSKVLHILRGKKCVKQLEKIQKYAGEK